MNSTTAPARDLAGDHDPVLTTAFRAWFAPVDPVAVAQRHLQLIGLFLIVGLVAAVALRIELLTPASDLVRGRMFGSLFTLHGILMFYFVLLPAFPGVLGHALMPGLLGARAMAFPRLANTSWHLLALGGLLVLGTFMVGGTGAGWSFDAAFGGRFAAPYVAPAASGVFLAAIGLALLGLNMVATVVANRPVGTAWTDLPPFVMSLFLSGLIAVVACPLLASCMAMVLADNLFGMALFDPASGADPRLFHSLFWLFGTPSLYMVLLPALGIVTEILARHAYRNRWFGRAMANRAFMLAAVLAFFLWGQHFLGQAVERPAALLASIVTAAMVATVGSVVMVWLAMLFRGGVRIDAAMAYALGFIVTAVLGGATGLLLSSPPVNVHLHQTTFVTAHVHIMTTAALGLAFLGGLHMMRSGNAAGIAAAVVITAGIQLTFSPLLLMGSRGLLRRTHEYAPEFQILQVLATAGMTILLVGLVVAMAGLRGQRTRAVQG